MESEGFPVSAPVTISAPRVVAEPMQGFTCDTSISGVPARLTFTLTTSTDVTAVRVVDSYNTPVVSMYLTDPQSEDATVPEKMCIRDRYKAQLKLADDRVTRFMWAAPGL